MAGPTDAPLPRYLDRPEQWTRLVDRLYDAAAPGVGIDTEFDGYDQSRDSVETAPRRAHLRVWSLAVLSGPILPRGHRRATEVVLPAASLEHPAIRRWLEDPDAPKWAHFAPAEEHSMHATARIDLRGLRCSLTLARWVFPERAKICKGPGYGLDVLGRDYLGAGKTEHFEELVADEAEVIVARRSTSHLRCCECGASPCRKRSGPGHQRSDHRVRTFSPERKKVPIQLRLADIFTPGHPRFERGLRYAGGDAGRCIELVDYLLRRLPKLNRSPPW